MFASITSWITSEKAGYALLAFFTSILAPYSAMIWSLFLFIILDFVTGIWAAKTNSEMLESRKVKKTVYKFGFGLICLYCAARMDMHLGISGTLSLANGFCVLIIGNEFYSILENMYRITGHRTYYILTQFTRSKIKDTIGQDIKEGK